MSKTTKTTARPVIICTIHRGVFYGFCADTTGENCTLSRAKMAIYWGTDKGIFQLAQTGPTSKSKISAEAPTVDLRGITAVLEVTPEAVAAWAKA